MRMDQATRFPITESAGRVRALEGDFNMLRARAFKQANRALRMQRVQKVVLTILAIALGSVAGWAFAK